MKIEVNPNAQIRQELLAEDYPCVVVDDFLANPEDLIMLAERRSSEFVTRDRMYPGPMLQLDAEDVSEVFRFIRSAMSKPFSFFRGGMKMESLLAMVNLQPGELSSLQRLCHTDPTVLQGHVHLAALVYLFDNTELGGTAFYRWKELALLRQAMTLDQKEPAAALHFLMEHFPTFNEAPCYMTQSNEVAELVGVIPARFNRMIFYPGHLPHSAYIQSPELLTGNFTQGRLTLNCFISALPASH